MVFCSPLRSAAQERAQRSLRGGSAQEQLPVPRLSPGHLQARARRPQRHSCAALPTRQSSPRESITRVARSRENGQGAWRCGACFAGRRRVLAFAASALPGRAGTATPGSLGARQGPSAWVVAAAAAAPRVGVLARRGAWCGRACNERGRPGFLLCTRSSRAGTRVRSTRPHTVCEPPGRTQTSWPRAAARPRRPSPPSTRRLSCRPRPRQP